MIMLLLKILSGILDSTVPDSKDIYKHPKTESEKRRERDKLEYDLWVMSEEYEDDDEDWMEKRQARQMYNLVVLTCKSAQFGRTYT